MLWGVRHAWSLGTAAVIGIWLMAAPATLGIGIERAAADSDHLVGALIVVVSIISLAEVARAGRFLNVPLGAWLLIAPWLLDGATLISQLNSALMGLAVIALSLPLGHLRDHYGAYDRWVHWSPHSIRAHHNL